jgi:hypothetical protein
MLVRSPRASAGWRMSHDMHMHCAVLPTSVVREAVNGLALCSLAVFKYCLSWYCAQMIAVSASTSLLGSSPSLLGSSPSKGYK